MRANFWNYPSLAALDDAQTLRQREWIRGDPGEDVP